MTHRATPCRSRWLGATLASTLLAVCALAPGGASAAPTKRFQIDQKGDVILIGNTLGQDCRAGVPMPVVGTVGNCGSDMVIADSAPDVFWRADSPNDGKADANDTITPENARSTAVLKLPAGAQVTYARIYWGSNLLEDKPDKNAIASSGVTIERVGTGAFSQKVRPTNPETDVQLALAGGYIYQASADVTALIQRYGAGAYRVSGVARRSLLNRTDDVEYAAWSMVIFYKSASEPVRNLTLFDGLDAVALGATVNLPIKGFNVPPSGTFDARLGVIAYEGDSDKADTVTFNGMPLTDQQNPMGNFFNSSRGVLGVPVSNVGDLPQLTGAPASMSGLDLDIVDVTQLVKAGDTTANLSITSADDIIYVGALVTSVRSKKPVLETTLIADPSSVRPNTSIEFTSTTKNVGDDDAGNIVIRHPIPDGLTYEPGSLTFVSGPDNAQNGKKTDTAGDDQAEVVTDPMTGKPQLVIRIGRGANGTTGGTLTPTDVPVVVKYKLKTGTNPMSEIPTQSQTTGTSVGRPELDPTTFPSGNGTNPGSPTIIRVPNVMADIKVTVTKVPDGAPLNTPVTYTVDVTNVGNTTDPGPIRVKFDIPNDVPDGDVSFVPGTDGWQCTKNGKSILCTRDTALAPGPKTKAVEVTIRQRPTSPTTDNQVKVTVGSDGAIDPKPADNTWDEVTGGGGGGLRVAGGGFSCSFGGGADAAGLWGLTSAAALLWAVARRRRRSEAHG